MGLGRQLLKEIIRRASMAEVHVLGSCIDAANSARIRLHDQLGFKHAGTFNQRGFKFGRWLDAAFYQMTLIPR
ncbi:N-acetyltransferase family protein [Methylobacillus sp. Pita1]|uniref:GNAT family N-acetyltransferase n=1 Tax=Methylobacillus sp. Pita1 TaxID=3382642 RepID=UPI0038B5E334